MRILAALPLLLLATPALAQDRAPLPHMNPRDAARLLSSPAAQNGIAMLVTRLSDAVMATRVGPMADLLPDADLAPDETLGDIAERRDPDYRRRVFGATRGAVAASAKALGAAAAMSDELARTADRLAGVLDGARTPR